MVYILRLALLDQLSLVTIKVEVVEMEKSFVPEHLGISVKDLKESIDWYQEKLGFALDMQEYQPLMKAKVAFMHNGNFRLEIIEHDESRPIPEERLRPNTDIKTQGTKHICLLHNDVPGLAAEFKELGVDIVMGPAFNGVQHMMFVRDPSGILIEIVSN